MSMQTKRARTQSSNESGGDVEATALPYLRLRDLIIDGSLAPGGPLIEVSLAERLGVSRTPIRDALRQLFQERLVAQAPEARLYKYVVAPLTAEDGRSLCLITGELEGLAAHDAALLPVATRVTLASAMRDANARLKALRDESDPHPRTFLEQDRAFHRLYVVAGSTPRLLAMHASMEPQAERYWRVYASPPTEALISSVAEHDQIVDAIERGDADAAREGARLNWQRSADRLVRVIERSGARGAW